MTASREHRVVVETNGLVRVSGGKYTTYRVMAEQTIDAALGVLGERAADAAVADRDAVGSSAPPTDRSWIGSRSTSPSRPACRPAVAARLVARHGLAAPDVVALGRELGLVGTLVGTARTPRGEVAWAARHELALSIDDVLARRMRLVHELPDRGAAIAPRVAAILGAELGWDGARQAAEVETFLDEARREFSVP